MTCSRCKIKTARIAIIDKDGYYTDDNLFCCECFAKDVNEKLEQAKKNRDKVKLN